MLRYLVIFMLFALPVSASERVLVFAAASQKEALEKIGELYESKCQCELVFSYAATSTLARQIAAGAQADVFISANEAWVDWLNDRKTLDGASRHVIAQNRLVLASSVVGPTNLRLLEQGRFSMADPASVPAGIYAREALESLELWDQVKANAVYGENVRIALSSISRGDLLSGIIYQSDLKLVKGLYARYVFPDHTHTPIHYVAIATSQNLAGTGFVTFLTSKQAQDIFKGFGFLPISVTKQG